MRRGNRFAILLCALVLVLSGCGTSQHAMNLREGAAVPGAARFEAGTSVDDTGRTYENAGDAAALLRDALVKCLQERRLDSVSAPDQPRVLLEPHVTEYQEGDAFKRWLMPGWGSTVLAVRCDMKEGASGQIVGAIEARRTVDGGGAYTIGAWKQIFARVAEDLAAELEATAGKAAPKSM